MRVCRVARVHVSWSFGEVVQLHQIGRELCNVKNRRMEEVKDSPLRSLELRAACGHNAPRVEPREEMGCGGMTHFETDNDTAGTAYTLGLGWVGTDSIDPQIRPEVLSRPNFFGRHRTTHEQHVLASWQGQQGAIGALAARVQ